MLESEILADVRAWLAEQPDVSIHRNNVGQVAVSIEEVVRWGFPKAWAEKVVQFCRSKFRAMTFGLGVGSSDLIGSVTYDLVESIQTNLGDSDEVVARHFARALAIEVKTPTGRLTEDQERFLAEKERIGWITGVARSVDDAKLIVERARRWEI